MNLSLSLRNVNFLTNSDNYEQITVKKLNSWFVKQRGNATVTNAIANSIACGLSTICVAIAGWQASPTERTKTRIITVNSTTCCSQYNQGRASTCELITLS